jgi:phenylacetate-CoA ligase
MRKFYSSKYYRHSPIPLQNIFLTIKGLAYYFARNGLGAGALNKSLHAAEFMDEEQLRELQFRNLSDLITHAWRHVPYYRNKFAEIGFVPGDLKSLDDLSLLPLIDKEVVRAHYPDFFAENYQGRLLASGSTSGTTGSLLRLKMDSRLIHLERAFALRQFRWAGFPERGGRVAVLRGDMVVPPAQDTPPFWRYDGWNREMWFSSYHISEESTPHYLARLERFDPHIIFAFPSALSALSAFAREIGCRPRFLSLKGIVTSSETFFDFDRAKVSGIFGARLHDWYGQFERVIFIGTCEEGSYHVFPDYGATEFLPAGSDENGAVQYELVGTGFLNRVMPLIRYRTGDTVTVPEKPALCGCGRHFPRVNAISGRILDSIVTPDGRRLSTMPGMLKDITGIRAIQFIQDSVAAVTVLVVPGPDFNETEEAKLDANFRQHIRARMDLVIKKVPRIPPGTNGKIKLIVSNLANVDRN